MKTIGGDATRASLGIRTVYRDLLKYRGSFGQFNRRDDTSYCRTYGCPCGNVLNQYPPPQRRPCIISRAPPNELLG